MCGYQLICFITYADESRGSKAFILICLCVCVRARACVCGRLLSVCPHDRTKTAETTITKLATEIVHYDSWLPI